MADDEEAPPTPQWFANLEEDAPPGPFNEEGKPHGQGVMKYPPPPAGEDDEEEKPGDVFEGNLENGVRQGKGKYTWSNGACYEGNYVDNKKHGKGKFSFPDKGVYEGDFSEDKMHGDGQYVYSNGDIYRGKFEAGKRHGAGMYHFKVAGCQMVGDWEEGGFLFGRWIYKDGSMFYGEFSKPVAPTSSAPASATPAAPEDPTNRAPSNGAYYFSGSQLIQKGNFKDLGVWQGDEPLVGKVDALSQMVVAPHKVV